MWPISHYVFCFHLYLCVLPSLGPPVLEQLEAGGIFKSPKQKKHINSWSSVSSGVVAGRGNHPSSDFAQLNVLNHWWENCINFLDQKACQFLTHDCSHSLQASVPVNWAMMGSAAQSARKIIMVIHWGDVLVSISDSKTMCTINLVQHRHAMNQLSFKLLYLVDNTQS